MTAYAYPKALTGLQDTQWSNLIAAFVPDGPATDGAFQATANGAGMTVVLAAGEAIIRGTITGDDEDETVTIATADASNARIDTIVKRLDRTGDPIIQTAVLQGTAAASPVAPTLTQDPNGVWEWPVADVRVDAGVVSIASGKVTGRRAIPLWSGLGDDHLLPVSKGGTGHSTLDALRAALGLGSSTAAPLPVAQGGTGAASMSLALLANLGIVISADQPAAGTALLWAKRSA